MFVEFNSFRSGGSLDNSYRPYITTPKDAYWFLLVAGTADSIRELHLHAYVFINLQLS